MRYYALQFFSVLIVIMIALSIRYALVDSSAVLPKFHRAYLLRVTRLKKLGRRAMPWTWLAILLVTMTALTIYEDGLHRSFYPYGRFIVPMAKAHVSPTPTATPPYQAYGRFTVVISKTPAH